MTARRAEPRALFFTDLDGTLLSPEASLPERNRRLIDEATRRGVVATIVTGRRLSSLQVVLPTLSGLSCRLAVSNGTVLLDAEGRGAEVLSELGWDLLEDLADRKEIRDVRLLGITAPAEAPDGRVPDCVVLEPGTRAWLTSWTPYRRETLQAADRRAVTRRALVHAALHLPTREEAEEVAARVRGWVPDTVSIHVIRSPVGDGAFTELVPSGGKGLAVERLREQLGAPRSRTGAIGDELNDCDLLDAVEHRYAVSGSVLARARPDAMATVTAAEGAVGPALEDFLTRIE